ncbi:MAG TPA: hypothetical protein VD926_09890 [Acidimicrobiales bacterium]|nr:hypothetical protein [Acidimicrobiales bacterium]
MSDEAACWLCGRSFRAPEVECLDCEIPLLGPGWPPTEDQARIRHLVDEHLDEEERAAVVPALAALPELLAAGEHVIWLTDARHLRDPGVLAVTGRHLRWVPVDDQHQLWPLAEVVEVVAWPGIGGQLRITTAADDLLLFSEVGSEVWVHQVRAVLTTATQSVDDAWALADRLESPDR